MYITMKLDNENSNKKFENDSSIEDFSENIYSKYDEYIEQKSNTIIDDEFLMPKIHRFTKLTFIQDLTEIKNLIISFNYQKELKMNKKQSNDFEFIEYEK